MGIGKGIKNIPMEQVLSPSECAIVRFFFRLVVTHYNETGKADLNFLMREFRIARNGHIQGRAS
jgi:hypothetical protein